MDRVMDAVKFIKEHKRLCERYVTCSGCPAYDNNGRCKLSVKQGDEAAKQVELLEEWATAHPRKTRQDCFLEQWLNAELDCQGVIAIDPCDIDKTMRRKDNGCYNGDCEDCRREFWMQEVE